MSKLLKTILIGVVAIFGVGILFAPSADAQTVDELIVEYWSESAQQWLPLSGPIFSETNFLPGDGVTRLIRVTNNSGQIQRIATEAINENDPNNFASQLNLNIKEGTTVIFNNTLAQFFSQGETYLSSLANGATTQYDFTITFNSGSGNDYQGNALGFDILVGFEGTEGGLPLPPPGGGTGGGLPSGLTIQDESVRVIDIDKTSATIIWTTSYLSTSQVIYGKEGEKHILDLTDTAGTPPKYGYEYTTPEYDIILKVKDHSVIITGLTSGATYYFRAVSHASFTVSREYSFVTLGAETTKKIGKIEEEGASPNSEGGEISTAEEGIPSSLAQGEDDLAPGFEAEEAGEIKEVVEEKEGSKINLGSLLAAIGGFFNSKNIWWIVIIIIVILIILFFLSRKRKKKITKIKEEG